MYVATTQSNLSLTLKSKLGPLMRVKLDFRASRENFPSNPPPPPPPPPLHPPLKMLIDFRISKIAQTKEPGVPGISENQR